MYIILKQFIIGLDIAWVAKLDDNDPIYQYDLEEDAINKLHELESSDNSGRKYRISETN